MHNTARPRRRRCCNSTRTDIPCASHAPCCFFQAEKAKRAARAAKFGLEQPDPLAYGPDPEEAKKAQRAAKFGSEYHADAALMDMGGCAGGFQLLDIGSCVRAWQLLKLGHGVWVCVAALGHMVVVV